MKADALLEEYLKAYKEKMTYIEKRKKELQFFLNELDQNNFKKVLMKYNYYLDLKFNENKIKEVSE